MLPRMGIGTRAPERIIPGDTVVWLVDAPDYRPAAGWSVEALLTHASNAVSGVSADNGDGRHKVTIDGTKTASLAAGTWRLVVRAVKGAERHTIEWRDVEVLPDPSKAGEQRSLIKQALDAIEAYMADPNNLQAASYSISGRQLSRYSATDLIALHDKYQQLYRREQQAADLAAGRKTRRRVLVRMHG